MAFSFIIGNQQPIHVLKRAIETKRIPHAYLFVGPANIGKTLIATEFAKAVNCQAQRLFDDCSDPAEPCDNCPACSRIDQGTFPDVHYYQPTAKVQATGDEGGENVLIEGSMINTEQIGRLITEANLKATHGRRKVFIISSAEAMNTTSANRLLKTLEEPPGDTTLILTTQNLSSLLPTIISRCQLLSFRPVPLHDAEAALVERYPEINPGTLRSIVALSGGRIGWAIRLLKFPEVLSLRSDLLDLAATFGGRDWFESMRIGEQFIETAEDWWLATEDPAFAEKALKASRDRVLRTRINDILDVLLSWHRDLYLLAGGGDPALLVNGDRQEQISAIANQRNPRKLARACNDIEEIRKQLRGNANLRLAMEVLAAKLLAATR